MRPSILTSLFAPLVLAPAGADPVQPFLLRTVHGEQDGDRFGARIERLADVDGDGVQDLLVGAPEAIVSGARRGAAYVVSGLTGATIRRHEGDFPGDEFGAALAQSFLDLDGDGVVDYAVGAPGRGYVRVFSGKKGKVIDTIMAPLPVTARFGAALAYLLTPTGGPLGGFAVGAPLDDTYGADAGSVWLLQDGAVLGVIGGFAENERLGAALALHSQTPTGDLLLAGAPGAANHGRTYAIATESHVVQETLVGPTTGTPAGFGSAAATYVVCAAQGPAVCGSFSVVGAPGSNAGQGIARIYEEDLSVAAQTLLGPAADSGLGAASARLGLAQSIHLAVGAPAGGAGAVHVFAAAGWAESFRIDGPGAGAAFGAALAGGSFDLDPGDELAVGAPDEGAGTVRIYRMAPVTPGSEFVIGDLLAATLDAPGSGDVDTATFEAVKGTKLKLRFQTGDGAPTPKVRLVARLKDATGKTRKSWTLKAKAKTVTKKTKLKDAGGWTLELTAAKKGSGGPVLVSTWKPDPPLELHLIELQKKAKPLKLKFATIAGATLDFTIDPHGAAPPTTIVLEQPDGTDHPDLAAYQSDLVFTGVPILQTGKHKLRITPAAPGTTEVAGTIHEPPAGGVVEID